VCMRAPAGGCLYGADRCCQVPAPCGQDGACPGDLSCVSFSSRTGCVPAGHAGEPCRETATPACDAGLRCRPPLAGIERCVSDLSDVCCLPAGGLDQPCYLTDPPSCEPPLVCRETAGGASCPADLARCCQAP
jgi:hypothetical protein